MAEIVQALPARGDSSATLVSEPVFKIVMWVGLGICTAAFALRISIRVVCFRRLLAEDSLMLFALACLVASSVTLELFLGDIYTLYRVGKQLEAPGRDFEDLLLRAVRADGIVIVLSTAAIWAVKLNFLVFFYRLTRQVRIYRIFWWIALGLVLACGVVALGIIPYRCVFGGSLSYIIRTCATEDSLLFELNVTKAGVAMDVASDFILICFPVSILWRSRIKRRSKVMFSAFFSLESFTIGVTIIRGSIFGAQFYKSLSQVDVKVMDFTWTLFWLLIEDIVAFLINCLISFRSLWTSVENKARNHRYRLDKQQRAAVSSQQDTIGSGGKFRRHKSNSTPGGKRGWDKFYDSVLDTLTGLEGTLTSADRDLPSYLELTGVRVTRAVDISRTTNDVESGMNGGLGSRSSQLALAAYCYYEESRTRDGGCLEPPGSMGSEATNSVQPVRPKLAHCVVSTPGP